ncbi:hypothetical protein R1sor_024083 [Riccia sorocarpa]|uniref:Transcription initiation factor TFIID subunit 9 n=1 Tax=Riccia sorocarpa TaxID=122646 RepID=A0ABD3GSH3_9MARC
MSGTVEEEEPKDAKLVKSILELMGVQKYEPRVVNQFMDLWYRYVVDVLGDAQLYSEHAGKQAIECDDVKLAIQSRVNFSFTQPPSRETLLELAKVRNSIPLPKIIGGPGVALPPEQDSLIAPTYQLDIPTKSILFTEDEMDVDEEDWSKPDSDKETSVSQPTNLQKSEHDGRKVSFSIGAKRPRS